MKKEEGLEKKQCCVDGAGWGAGVGYVEGGVLEEGAGCGRIFSILSGTKRVAGGGGGDIFYSSGRAELTNRGQQSLGEKGRFSGVCSEPCPSI